MRTIAKYAIPRGTKQSRNPWVMRRLGYETPHTRGLNGTASADEQFETLRDSSVERSTECAKKAPIDSRRTPVDAGVA